MSEFPIKRFPDDAVALRPVRFVKTREGEQLKYYEAVELLTENPPGHCHMYARRCYYFGGVANGPSHARF